MGLADDYTKSIWNQQRMNGLYPPDDTLQLGDIVEYKNGIYHRRSTLDDKGVLDNLDEKLRVTKGKKQRIGLKSESGVKVRAKAKGKLVPGVALESLERAEAGAVVTMSDKDSYLLSLDGIATESYVNPDAMGGALSSLFWRNKWDTKWIVVTEIWRPKQCMLLASSKEDSQFELQARGRVNAKVAEADLAAGFTVIGNSSDQAVIEDRDGTVPLFRGYRWLAGFRPAGRKGGLFKAIDAARVDGLDAAPYDTLHPYLMAVEFDPTQE
jgi:hypothetical protein